MENYIFIDRGDKVPGNSDFSLVLDNDLMEPHIPKGSIVYVSRREAPEEMEIGIFLYRGQVYCRQWCEDYSGALHLLCSNPKREEHNVCIKKQERESCRCLGKVLLGKKPGMPVYKNS